MAIGLIEVLGFSVALETADSMCKAAEVIIDAIDTNNPADEKNAKIPVVVQVKISGGISDVKAALEVGKRTALKHISEHDIILHCITAEHGGLQKLLHYGKLIAPPIAAAGKKKNPAPIRLKKGDADEN